MTHSETVFDEDWSEEDMRAALDWQGEQALICRGCGGFVDETMQVGADDDYDAEIVVCHRCAPMDRAEKEYRDAGGDTAGMKRRSWEAS